MERLWRMKMSRTLVTLMSKLNRRRFSNNTQRVLHTLITAKGEWIPRSAFRVASAGSRLRDLRKDGFGGFDIQCRSAASLGLAGGRHTFYYRLPLKDLSVNKLESIFEGVV